MNQPIKEVLVAFGAFGTIFIVFVASLIAWCTQYHWKRRKLYALSMRTNGPTAIPIFGNAFSFMGSNSEILDYILGIAKKYESPMRVWLGPKLFLGFYKPHQVEIILNSQNALAKGDLYKHGKIIVGNGLLTAPVAKWKRHRKIILPTFNQKILDAFVEIFSAQSRVLNDQLEKTIGKGSFDIFDYVSCCTLDIICETAMGITVNAQTTDSEYVKWTNRAMEIVLARMVIVWYYFDFLFNRTSLAKEINSVASKMRNFTGTVVREKRAAYQKKLKDMSEYPEILLEEEPKQKKTFLKKLIEICEKEGNFTDEELREEVDTFMLAGSDTSASTNSFVLIMLAMYQEVQDKVYEEIMDVVGPDKDVECADLGKLVYLERVIKETLRLFPVGPIILREPSGDITMNDGFVIPAGSSIAVIILKMHRDPEIWPDPLKFDPDRFLPEEISKRHLYSWLPFSGGPRNCVGIKYAMMAMKVLISTVIRKYRVSTDYKSIEDIKLRLDVVLKPANGYKLKVDLRE